MGCVYKRVLHQPKLIVPQLVDRSESPDPALNMSFMNKREVWSLVFKVERVPVWSLYLPKEESTLQSLCLFLQLKKKRPQNLQISHASVNKGKLKWWQKQRRWWIKHLTWSWMFDQIVRSVSVGWGGKGGGGTGGSSDQCLPECLRAHGSFCWLKKKRRRKSFSFALFFSAFHLPSGLWVLIEWVGSHWHQTWPLSFIHSSLTATQDILQKGQTIYYIYQQMRKIGFLVRDTNGHSLRMKFQLHRASFWAPILE